MDYLKEQLLRLRQWVRQGWSDGRTARMVRLIGMETARCTGIVYPKQAPNDLLIRIPDYLPTPSAAAFSICCMQIKRLVGDQCLEDVARQRPADTLEFLDLLALDLPDQVICYACHKLHEIKMRLDTSPGPVD